VPKLSFVIGHALRQSDIPGGPDHGSRQPLKYGAPIAALQVRQSGLPTRFPRFSDRFLPARPENHYSEDNEREATPAKGKAMNAPSEMNFEDMLRVRLEVLKREHRDLDEAIHALETAGRPDQLTLRRLKKQKLALKDQIVKLEDQLIPDIIA
jgi:hypothetical protein